MVNITTGLQSNEIIKQNINSLENRIVKTENSIASDYLGSVKIIMQNNTGTFKIKQSFDTERVVMYFIMIDQYKPLGTVLSVYKNNEVILPQNNLIKSVTPTINGDGTITFEVMAYESGMWSHCAVILPKDYIV